MIPNIFAPAQVEFPWADEPMSMWARVALIAAFALSAVVSLVALAGVMIGASLLISQAHAAPPPGADPNSPMAHWYRGLQQPASGISCCSMADCDDPGYFKLLCFVPASGT